MPPAIHITRKPIKHLYLRINRNGELHLSAPQRMPHAEIMAFVAQKQDWIQQKQQQQAARAKASNDNTTLTVFGKTYAIVRHVGAYANDLILDNGVCHIFLQPSNATAEIERRLIVEYYRYCLQPILTEYVTQYQPIIGVYPKEIRTKNMKTKWGTCNTHAARLWFNVQLARFPKSHIEYVVVHEMVHLLEPSHNQRFYALVEKAMPNWKRYHDALKRAD